MGLIPLQHAPESPGESWLLVLPSMQDLNSWVRFSYSYFLTNICPLLSRKRWTHWADPDGGWDVRFWALMMCDLSWCYLSCAGQIRWKDIAVLTLPRWSWAGDAPFLQITSGGPLFNETDHSITNGTRLNALYYIAGGKLQIFQGWEAALCMGSLLKRKGMFHNIWPCGLKLSVFVPWNSRMWRYISGQLSSTVFQKLTKPIKWAMIWWQHAILQFSLYPANLHLILVVSLIEVKKKKSNYVDKRFPNRRTAYKTSSC